MTAEFESGPFLAQLTTQPGVYRMYGDAEVLLYVGKARNLRKRVSSYFLRASGNPRIEAMVARICRVEVTVTRTEDEALVLEATLIKQQSPRYNVSLRDDKSYPYLRIDTPSGAQGGPSAFPRISFHRGTRVPPHRYFGPYPSAASVRETLVSLQKLFRLRPCSDVFFSHRTRPCLQHQIQRCSAPCVARIGPMEYAQDVERASQLLEGGSESLARQLQEEMAAASGAQEFERAARVRDQIAALRRLQGDREMAGGVRDADFIALAPHAAHSCVVVLCVRDGVNLGHRSFFPSHPPELEAAAILSGFLEQYYLERQPPARIFVPERPEDADWLEHWLAARAGRKVRLHVPKRGARHRMQDVVLQSAQQALSARLSAGASSRERLAELQQVLALDQLPQRIECFDISHTQGELPVAACVVFDGDGPVKSGYRRFNIEQVTPGDDYAAIGQAVRRRYARVQGGDGRLPDLLLIDGGAGQLRAATDALLELGIDSLPVVGVAKGPSRKPGLEQLHLPEHDSPLVLPPDSPGLHLIQRIRDEAHRFAISGHRGRRARAREVSELDRVDGLGPLRKKRLLQALGGLAQVQRATIEDLARVEGISLAMARRIHQHFH